MRITPHSIFSPADCFCRKRAGKYKFIVAQICGQNNGVWLYFCKKQVFLSKATASITKGLPNPHVRQPPLATEKFSSLVPGQLHSSVSAVLDDNSLRSLGNSAGSIPSHAIAGQTIKGHAGELSLERIADVRGIHVAVDAAGNRSLIDGVDDIVSIGSELVRGIAVRCV